MWLTNSQATAPASHVKVPLGAPVCAGRERVLILLSLLGAARQVALPSADVVAVR